MRTADVTDPDQMAATLPAPVVPARFVPAIPYAAALVVVTLTYWTIDIISPVLPAIKNDLHLTAAGTGLIFSLLFLGRLLGNLPAAFFVDRIGAAATAVVGGGLLTAGSLTASSAGGVAVLLPARVLQGIGISLLVNAALRSILLSRPGRGVAMTVFGFAATAGGVFGLQSGGFLTERTGWRATFLLCTAIGMGIVAISGGARLAARRVAAADRVPTRVTAASIAVPRSMMAGAFLLNLSVFLNYSIWIALPLYTEDRFGATAEANANLLLVITLMHLFAAFPAGRLIRAWGSLPTLGLGLAVAMLGTILVVPMPGTAWIALPMVLYGAGQVAAANAAGDVLLHLGGQSGRAVGMVRFSSDLGLVVGPFVAGALADQFGYRAPFVAFSVMVAGTLALLSLRGRALAFAQS